MFLVNSRNPYFSAALSCSRRAPFTLLKPTFFRSYGGNLPNSLERVLSNALGFSPHPPESVCGTDALRLHTMLFLEAWDYLPLAREPPSGLLSLRCLIFVHPVPIMTLRRLCPPLGYPSPSHLASMSFGQPGNINPAAIAYALRPRLRSRLTLGGLTCPRKPWIFGGRESHTPYRYSYRHQHSHAVQPPFRSTFVPHATLLYRTYIAVCTRGFGTRLEPRYIFGAA